MISLAATPPESALASVHAVIFYGFALLAVASAWAIVATTNIVRMAVYLLLTLAGVAGIYFSLYAELLAAIQLIVYAGGTLILIVFGVMLTSRSPHLTLAPRGWEMAAGISIGAVMAALLLTAMFISTPIAPDAQADGLAARGYDQVHLVGRGLLTRYLAPFEIAAVLLLVVMIGAAYMARRRLHSPASQADAHQHNTGDARQPSPDQSTR